MNCSHLYGIRLCAARADGFNECLPPVNGVCEGYVFTGVCLSTGGVSVSVRGRSLSREWGSLSRGWGFSVQRVGSLCPGGSLSMGSLSRRGVSVHGGGVSVWGGLGHGDPPVRQRAGGTHPTGMHSGLDCNRINRYRTASADFHGLQHKFGICDRSRANKSRVGCQRSVDSDFLWCEDLWVSFKSRSQICRYLEFIFCNKIAVNSRWTVSLWRKICWIYSYLNNCSI